MTERRVRSVRWQPSFLVAVGLVAALAAACGGGGTRGNTASDLLISSQTVISTAVARVTPIVTPAATSQKPLCQIFSYGSDGCASPTPTPRGTQPPTATSTAISTRLPAPPPASVTRAPAPTIQRATGTVPGGTPSLAQLRQAILTERDLGGKWSLNDSGSLTNGRYPGAYADFDNDNDLSVGLSIEVHDARNGATDYLALLGLAGKKASVSLNEVARLTYGTDGVHYHYVYDDVGTRLYGDLAAWRQGSVVVVMQIEGEDANICLCDLARQQDSKLRATIR